MFKWQRVAYSFWLALLLCAAACQSPSQQPVELFPEDVCAQCKMAISEKQYAAEFVRPDGAAFKFDDLGCLARFVATDAARAEHAVFYVMDYDQRRWLRADTAFFVHSARYQTPMRGGTAAFGEQTRAAAAANALSGRLRTWQEVLDVTE